MKCLLLISLCFAAVSYVTSSNPSIDDMKVAYDCMKAYKVTEEDIAKMDAKDPSDTAKCMGGCVYLKLGLDKNPGGAVQKFDKDLSDEKKDKLMECFRDITASDDCGVGQQLVDCEKQVAV